MKEHGQFGKITDKKLIPTRSVLLALQYRLVEPHKVAGTKFSITQTLNKVLCQYIYSVYTYKHSIHGSLKPMPQRLTQHIADSKLSSSGSHNWSKPYHITTVYT